MALYGTVLEVIADAATELGLVGSLSAVVTSEDPNILQLLAYLKRKGRELAQARDWAHLLKEHSFVTDSAENEYDLPADFLRMVDQSYWNRSQQKPGIPLGAEAWQYAKAALSTPSWTVLFRARNTSSLELWPQPPTDGETIAFEYLSRYWVQANGQTAPNKDAPTADNDTVCFDSSMIVTCLKLEWRGEHGYDVTKALDDFNTQYGLAESNSEIAAPKLSLVGPSDPPWAANIPDGSWDT